MADETKKTANTTPKKEEKTFSQSEVERMVAEAVAKAMANMPKQQPATILQMKPEEYVTLLYMGVKANGTTVSLGALGQINRVGGTLQIRKDDFFQKLDWKTEKLLANRKIVVIDGLTDEERKRYGVDYTESELLTQDMYFKFLEYSQEKIVEIFEKLCPQHKEIVAKLFATAYSNGSNKIHLDTLKKLNKISKSVDKDGMFTLIIKDLSKKMGDDED